MNDSTATGAVDTATAAADGFVAALRAAAPYVHAHNGRTFVIAFGGETCARPDFDRLVYDIALLHSLGVKLVLVHGARPQIEAQLAARRLEPKLVGDRRVTDPAAMECVKAAVGALRLDIEAKLSTGLASTPMGGARLRVAGGNWVTARPLGIRDGVDHQLTGEVRRVDFDAIRELLATDRIALLSPIGQSPTGETFNLRAGEVAQEVATGLGADKLIFILAEAVDRRPLAENAGDAGQLPLGEAEQLLSAGQAGWANQDRALLAAALAAGGGGVKRVHLIGAATDGGLLRELYTRDGCGLMIYADDNYESLRKATIEDVGGILALIKPLEETGVLVPRSREQLELGIGDFDVMVRDGAVIACSALFTFPRNRMAELSCVAVHPGYRNSGRAAALLSRTEACARRQGIETLFALTTHSPHWFVEHGFAIGRIEDLPMQKQRIYNYQRNSLVLIKKL